MLSGKRIALSAGVGVAIAGCASTQRSQAPTTQKTIAPEAPAASPSRVPTPDDNAEGAGPGLAADHLQRVVFSHAGAIRACFEWGEKDGYGPPQQVVVEFVVGADGTVATTELMSSSLASLA